jgi:hypothetical protein
MRIFYLLIFLALLSAGCNDLKIVSATRATTVSDSLKATVTNAMPETITGERLLDTNINPEIAEFENRISDFDMDSLVFEFSEFQGPTEATLENTYLSLLDLDRQDIVAPVFVPLLALKEYSDSGQPYVIVFNQADSEAIAQKLLEERAAIVQFESSLADRPVEFQLKATLYLKVTGELF